MYRGQIFFIVFLLTNIINNVLSWTLTSLAHSPSRNSSCHYGHCSQLCDVSTGTCSCYDGFHLTKNLKECRSTSGVDVLVFVAQNEVYYQIHDGKQDRSRFALNLEGEKRDERNVGIASRHRVTFDNFQQRLWIWKGSQGREPGRLVVIDVFNEGEKPTKVDLPDISQVSGLAIDWRYQDLYVAESERRVIDVCRQIESLWRCFDIIKFEDKTPSNLILDTLRNKLFWISHHDDGKTTVHSSFTNGRMFRVVMEDHLYRIFSMAFDPYYGKNGRLYFAANDVEKEASATGTDESSKSNRFVISTNVDGSDLRFLFEVKNEVRTFSHLRSISVVNGFLNGIVGEKGRMVARLKLTGDNNEADTTTKNVDELYCFHSMNRAGMDVVADPCAVSKCRHFCLRGDWLNGYRCFCAPGYILAEDRVSCVYLGPMMISTGSEIFAIQGAIFNDSYPLETHVGESTRPSSGNIKTAKPLLANLGHVAALDFHRETNRLFYSDVAHDVIGSATVKNGESLHVEDAKIVVSQRLGTVATLQVDWLSDTLWWLEADTWNPHISASHLNGTGRVVILDHLTIIKPTGFCLHPIKGLLFFADSQGLGRIEKCRMNGEECVSILDKIGNARNLLIDYERERLLWSEAGNVAFRSAQIRSSTFDGRDGKVLVDGLSAVDGYPTSLTLQQGYLFWTDAAKRAIFSVNIVDPASGIRILRTRIKGYFHALLSPSASKPTETNACHDKNGGCSHLCIPLPDNERECHCPVGHKREGTTCLQMECEKGLFRCVDGVRCILRSHVCDGWDECDDRSDELGCSLCGKDDFVCGNGKCVRKDWICDGHKDCPNGSDEAYCPSVCPPGHKSCHDGQCINATFWCDRQFDCEDKSDEAQCREGKCNSHEYYCESAKECQSKHRICDGKDDCVVDIPGSFAQTTISIDESSCSVRRFPTNRCFNSPHEWMCNNGFCIPSAKVCDDHPDCGEGEDEAFVFCNEIRRRNDTCHTDYFVCGPGECVPAALECDHKADCSNGKDEERCTICESGKTLCSDKSTCFKDDERCDNVRNCPAGDDEIGCFGECEDDDDFLCSDQRGCISWNKVCDGVADCNDHSDESGRCDSACAHRNGGCNGTCQSTPTGPRCFCPKGYKLFNERYCDDVDECVEELFGCGHKQRCVNTVGSFECSCSEHYRSEVIDQTEFCLARGSTPHLLAVQGNKVIKLDDIGIYASSTSELAFSEEFYRLHDTEDWKIEFNFWTRQIIWASPRDGRIFISNFSRGNVSEPIEEVKTTYEPTALAIDWTTGNLYIGDAKKAAISICSTLASTFFYCIDDLLILATTPIAIAVYPQERTLFWSLPSTANHNGVIGMSSMDGYGIQTLVKDVSVVTSFAIDFARANLYWVDAANGGVYFVRIDGVSERRGRYPSMSRFPRAATKLTALTHHAASHLDVFEDFAYILSDSFYTVHQFNILHPERKVRLLQFDFFKEKPSFLKVYHLLKQPPTVEYCFPGACAKICVLSYAYRKGYDCLDNHHVDVFDLEMGEIKEKAIIHIDDEIPSKTIIFVVCWVAGLFVIIIFVGGFLYLKYVHPDMLPSNIVVHFKKNQHQRIIEGEEVDDDNDLPEQDLDRDGNAASEAPTSLPVVNKERIRNLKEAATRAMSARASQLREAVVRHRDSVSYKESLSGFPSDQDHLDNDDGVQDIDGKSSDNVDDDDIDIRTANTFDGRERIKEIWNGLENKWAKRKMQLSRSVGDPMKNPLDPLEVLEGYTDDAFDVDGELSLEQTRRNSTGLGPVDQQPSGYPSSFLVNMPSDFKKF